MRKSNLTSVLINFYYYGLLILLIFLSIFFNLFNIALIGYITLVRKRLSLIGLLLVGLIIITFLITPKQYNNDKINDLMVVDSIRKYDDYNIVVFKLNNYHFNYYDYNDDYEIGNKYLINGSITPINENKNFYGFDYVSYNLGKNIYGVINIDDSKYVGFNNLYLLKAKLFNYINSLDSNLRGFASILLFDYESDLESVLTLKVLNLLYLISISALNIYVLVRFIKYLLFHLNVNTKYHDFVILCFYLLLISLLGLTFVILRLLINQFLKLILSYYNIRLPQLSKAHLSFYLMVLLKPTLIFNQSLIIYFLIVNSIILLKPIYENFSNLKRNFFLSILIQAIIMLFNSKINILTIILSPILIYLSISLFISILISIILPFLWPLFHLIINIFENLVLTIDPNYLKPLNLGHFSAYLIFLSVISVSFVIYTPNVKRKLLGLIILSFLVISPTLELYLISNPKLIILDVGQGDSALIIDKSCVIVIDAYQNVSNTLIKHAVNRIDYLIITHTDNDHFLEFELLSNNFRINHVLMSSYEEYQNNQLTIINPTFNQSFNCDKFKINILGPLKDYGNKNDNSLVVSITYLNYKMLFTGDISSLVEADLIDKYGYNLKSDYLKVAHHGSKTSSSSEFIKYVNPNWASISLKIDNRYGFPHNEVIKTLKDNQVKIYRTDKDGAILFDIRKKLIKTYV